jgi:outer membrane protein TolC
MPWLCKKLAFESAAAKTLEIARKRLLIGDISYLEVLTAQQNYQQALLNLVIAQANRFSDTAALFQALGGGWWNRADVEPPRQWPFFSIFGSPIY